MKGDLNARSFQLSIDAVKDYGPLASLVDRAGRTIHMDWICNHWDRMGQFYASFENGHTAASKALKRLDGYSNQNYFYRANRELRRIFKTEYILQYMSDPLLRKRSRRVHPWLDKLLTVNRASSLGEGCRLSRIPVVG